MLRDQRRERALAPRLTALCVPRALGVDLGLGSLWPMPICSSPPCIRTLAISGGVIVLIGPSEMDHELHLHLRGLQHNNLVADAPPHPCRKIPR